MSRGGRRVAVGVLGLVLGAVVAPAAGERGAVVREGLRLHAAQESATWGQHGLSFGRAMDGVVTSEAEALRELEQSRAQRAHAPFVGVCEAVDGFRSMSAGRLGEAREAEEAGDALVAWLGLDRTLAPELTEGSDGRARVEEVLGRYCAPGRSQGGGPLCSGSAEDHARDVHPGVLLEAATFDEGDDAIAAMDWIRNVAVPLLEEPPAIGRGTTAGERRRILEARAASARGGACGRVSPGARGRAGSGRFGRCVGRSGGCRAGGRDRWEVVSRHELLRAVVRGRFEDPDYFARLQAADRTNLLRERISAKVVSFALEFEGYRDDERQVAMLAARLARAVERERRVGH